MWTNIFKNLFRGIFWCSWKILNRSLRRFFICLWFVNFTTNRIIICYFLTTDSEFISFNDFSISDLFLSELETRFLFTISFYAMMLYNLSSRLHSRVMWSILRGGGGGIWCTNIIHLFCVLASAVYSMTAPQPAEV